ncbi:MAG: nitroreductase family protein [Candidatus Bathyarchaeia archaeon]
MEFYQVVRTRRSIRKYKPDPIPREILNRIFEAVRIAPSGSNRQPWRFILITDAALKRKLAAACHNQKFIAEAPIAIVALAQKLQINRGGYMGEMSTLMDTTIAFTHLVLAARAEGVGTCWIGAFDNDEIKKLLNIPDEYYVVAVTPLGYPTNGEKAFTEPVDRKSLKEILTENEF